MKSKCFCDASDDGNSIALVYVRDYRNLASNTYHALRANAREIISCCLAGNDLSVRVCVTDDCQIKTNKRIVLI